MDPVGIGLIGCGNISDAYLKALAGFECLKVVGLADLRPEAAQAKAAQHGLRACRRWPPASMCIPRSRWA